MQYVFAVGFVVFARKRAYKRLCRLGNALVKVSREERDVVYNVKYGNAGLSGFFHKKPVYYKEEHKLQKVL